MQFFSKPSEHKFIREVKFIVVLLFIILGLRTFLYQHYLVPSGSMIPEILIGDMIIVDKKVYGYTRYSMPFHLPLIQGHVGSQQRPQRFDVIVFNNCKNEKLDYIKRCLGLPGDRIQIRHGILYINDNPCTYERIEDYPFRLPDGQIRMVEQYIERFPLQNFSHKVIYLFGKDSAFHGNDTSEYIVPENQYFVLGCNRHNSQDSRFSDPGYVPAERIFGQAKLIFFSVDFGFYGDLKDPLTWYKFRFVPRFDRLGTML